VIRTVKILEGLIWWADKYKVSEDPQAKTGVFIHLRSGHDEN
jgi:hypothetical protein